MTRSSESQFGITTYRCCCRWCRWLGNSGRQAADSMDAVVVLLILQKRARSTHEIDARTHMRCEELCLSFSLPCSAGVSCVVRHPGPFASQGSLSSKKNLREKRSRTLWGRTQKQCALPATTRHSEQRASASALIRARREFIGYMGCDDLKMSSFLSVLARAPAARVCFFVWARSRVAIHIIL